MLVWAKAEKGFIHLCVFMYVMRLNFKTSVIFFRTFRFFQEQIRCFSTLATRMGFADMKGLM